MERDRTPSSHIGGCSPLTIDACFTTSAACSRISRSARRLEKSSGRTRPPSLRAQIIHLANDLSDPSNPYLVRARSLILRDEGVFFLVGANMQPQQDATEYVLRAEDDIMPTVVEALRQAIAATPSVVGDSFHHRVFPGTRRLNRFDSQIADLLKRHRVSYELIDGEMVPFSSRELHVEVVAPTLTLLAGKAGWEKVELAYQAALAELSGGSPADAITDAGTAVQEALEAAGFNGNQLGKLITDARDRGAFGSHDTKLTNSIADIVVGALILRLTSAAPRTSR